MKFSGMDNTRFRYKRANGRNSVNSRLITGLDGWYGERWCRKTHICVFSQHCQSSYNILENDQMPYKGI